MSCVWQQSTAHLSSRQTSFAGYESWPVRVWINCSYRKIACESCNRIVVEDLGFFNPYSRVTHRLAAYIHELCKMLTITEVAKHFGMNWKTVKAIDKFF
ncbi:MAG: transposase family protein [Planctomycetia bacterium]|nr:transposase family protein [Planctomycetia bacterium]